MKYAKKNLRDVEDSAVKFGLSNSQEARFPRADLGAEQTGINFLTVKPSQREAFAHRHHTAEEIYVVLSGTGHVKLDGDAGADPNGVRGERARRGRWGPKMSTWRPSGPASKDRAHRGRRRDGRRLLERLSRFRR
jgi:hypothetical protein